MQTAAMKKTAAGACQGERPWISRESIPSPPISMPANAQPDNGSKRGNNPHFEAGKLPALKGEVHEHRKQRSASSTLLYDAALSCRRRLATPLRGKVRCRTCLHLQPWRLQPFDPARSARENLRPIMPARKPSPVIPFTCRRHRRCTSGPIPRHSCRPWAVQRL
jgi:hypothetical protein